MRPSAWRILGQYHDNGSAQVITSLAHAHAALCTLSYVEVLSHSHMLDRFSPSRYHRATQLDGHGFSLSSARLSDMEPQIKSHRSKQAWLTPFDSLACKRAALSCSFTRPAHSTRAHIRTWGKRLVLRFSSRSGRVKTPNTPNSLSRHVDKCASQNLHGLPVR